MHVAEKLFRTSENIPMLFLAVSPHETFKVFIGSVPLKVNVPHSFSVNDPNDESVEFVKFVLPNEL